MSSKRLSIIAIIALVAVVVGISARNTFHTKKSKSISPPPFQSQTLADASSLLPNSEQVVTGERINDHAYWIWEKTTGTDSSQETDRSWVVDLASKQKVLIGELHAGYPGATASHDRSGDRYYHVRWLIAWEQGSASRDEYIDRTTGRLAYQFDTSNDGSLDIRHDDKEVRLSFASSTCAEHRARITGIRINDRTVQLLKPEIVRCTTNDMTGISSIDEFTEISLSEKDRVIRVGLPWDESLEISADDLKVNEVPLASPENALKIFGARITG